jgi:hypothetical protein
MFKMHEGTGKTQKRREKKKKGEPYLWLRSLVATLCAVPLWAPWAQLLPVC